MMVKIGKRLNKWLKLKNIFKCMLLKGKKWNFLNYLKKILKEILLIGIVIRTQTGLRFGSEWVIWCLLLKIVGTTI